MWIDLVSVRHKPYSEEYLFYAPFCSRLVKGDDVVVKTKHGEEFGTVTSILSVDTENQEMFEFIKNAYHATKLKPVLKRIYYTHMDYEKDEIPYDTL